MGVYYTEQEVKTLARLIDEGLRNNDDTVPKLRGSDILFVGCDGQIGMLYDSKESKYNVRFEHEGRNHSIDIDASNSQGYFMNLLVSLDGGKQLRVEYVDH